MQLTQPHPTEDHPILPVQLEADSLPVVNYALYHNGAPVIRNVTIHNNSETAIENVELHITATPEFTLPFRRHIDLLPPGKSVTISHPELLLSTEHLANTTEKFTGMLHLRLQQGDSLLAASDRQISVLAFDEWHGLLLYPEMLAAFVTPNHPSVAPILSRASALLGQWTGDPSLDGYQSQDPNRVLRQAGAIYTAISEQAIAYAVPPASFEQTGQRVRLCDMVLQQKLGTCLDLTLLYASCLEAAGLHPLLIATTGHIFTGVWLEEQMFPECVQDDVSLITKRLAAGVNEIAVAETTCVTSGRSCSFDEARSLGQKKLDGKSLECILDVRRARLSGIAPLPQRTQAASAIPAKDCGKKQPSPVAAPQVLDQTIRVDASAGEEQLPKLVQWERKLLDLGLRNNLINLRLTKTQLPILTGSLDALENALSDGSDFSLLPKPSDRQWEDFSFEALHEHGSDSLVQADFDNKRLRSILSDTELTKAIKNLYRTAKAALEENGANTLYLVLGMLRWYETKRSTRPRYAPIILLPIEMVRKSAAQGYIIRMRDEEAQMNITLLEKLKQDFGITVSGLDPLPVDDHGVDIRRVFTILRKAVMEQPHWDVVEAASIGIFSFSQFVMWNDIRHRTQDLMHNKVVRSLMEGKLCWDAQPLEMGAQVSEDNVLLPMSADASQLYAIRTACNGESFVLHGPPGTGKSQTITSLIANALAAGKRVLFVAEKMAALEVVQKRLETIGIGPFCLELHSNKSRKKDVLEQLRRASEVTKTKTAEDFAAKAKQLSALRAELDQYARQLHKPLKCGSTLFTLINDYEQCKDAPELAPFSRSFLQTLTAADIEQQKLILERLTAAARDAGHPQDHPLSAVGLSEYSQTLRSRLAGVVEAYANQIDAISGPIGKLAQALGRPEPTCAEDVQTLADIAFRMIGWYGMPGAWADQVENELYFAEVAALADHSMKAAQLEATLLQNFDVAFLEKDGRQLFEAYAAASEKWFLPKALEVRKLLKAVRVYAKTPVTKENLMGHLTMLRDYQQEQQEADALLAKYSGDLGGLFIGKDTDWQSIHALATEARTAGKELRHLCGNLDAMPGHLKDKTLETAVTAVLDCRAAFTQAKSDFDKLLNIAQFTGDYWLPRQRTLCQALLIHAEDLQAWITYVAAAQEAHRLGLGNVVDSYRNGTDHDLILSAYRKALLTGLITDAIDAEGVLNGFSGAVFNQKIQQFKRLDQEWTRLSRQEVYCRLAAKVPDFTREAAHSSELGILQRCIKSGGRGVSIRKLFDQIPNLLPRLCPCMLMSPISAAQYLDPSQEPFDIVVFDEASQLPTCKAVGVLARGKDAVIVGDPKQMPPTSFFASNTVDEDNLDVEDLESILDDCLALNMPQSHLLWHYRSRHESLIAFSNRHFYENKLYTFPSVNDRESKVRLVHVDGVFERGKSRVNREEAAAVVEEIRRRAKDPILCTQSLGVVTFNISQQHLIDDLLTEACAQDPELEKWVYGSEEPLFIKNLENVQGDERDVILFSIGFGPDENGKVYMNFGPLNRDGGWRRLNVAVSRARCEMVVYSTLRPDQLDLNRTKAEGVAALRSFLEYAEGRPAATEDGTEDPLWKSSAAVADAICKELEASGYETARCVGRSAYRIDIGVVDPEDPEQYLLGILLDGADYGYARTTRDREVAQIGVLNGLGWNVVRVWCMDWWNNREKELNRIWQAIQDIRTGNHSEGQTPALPPEKKSAAPTPAPVTAKAPVAAVKAPPVYSAAALKAETLTADAFVEPKNAAGIRRKIEKVIASEAPVSENVLIRRVVQSYGITRAGSRIQTHMDGILRKMRLNTTTQEGVTFYWNKTQNPADYALFRINGEEENRRDAKDIPAQEVANAVCVVLHEQISMAQEDLLRETAKKLGYTRLGGNVLSALSLGIRYACDAGYVISGTNTYLVLSEQGTQRAEATAQQYS